MLEHDFLGKPVPAFPDHALAGPVSHRAGLLPARHALCFASHRERPIVGRKKQDTTPKDGGKPKKPPPKADDDDDYEDGDIATPKKDRYGNDDEPLE